jgi:hypothetical protein
MQAPEAYCGMVKAGDRCHVDSHLQVRKRYWQTHVISVSIFLIDTLDISPLLSRLKEQGRAGYIDE